MAHPTFKRSPSGNEFELISGGTPPPAPASQAAKDQSRLPGTSDLGCHKACVHTCFVLASATIASDPFYVLTGIKVQGVTRDLQNRFFLSSASSSP